MENTVVIKNTAVLLAFFAIVTITSAQTFGSGENPPLIFRGYVKEMPALQFGKGFTDPSFMNIFQNRLNFRWNITKDLHFAAEGRNMVYYSKMFQNNLIFKDLLEMDASYFDMSSAWLHEGSWIAHSMVDRLYVDWQQSNWQMRVGRQRINWGVNMVSNPNDLFNTYSFFDFDYAERPGTDALRLQHYFGDMSKAQLAISPGRKKEEMVAAIMINLNRWNYDFQTLAGYYNNRLALGAGWAGHIGGAGFKGEATWFYDLKRRAGVKRGNLVAASGVDYMFGSGTFVVLEFLYNGGYKRTPDKIMLITQPLQADNLMFSEFAVTLSAQHPLSTIVQGRLAIMALPDIEAGFIMPSISYSVVTNLDLGFVAQIFIGGNDSIFEEAGSSWFASLKYSF
ncbi:MAG: hypothetical protein IH597_05390 [Bacteroidales bacterium]|nr:hypothetical protein [Bacteroidales bacterium]